MKNKIKPIPEGFHTVTPYLMVQGAATLIDFMKHAFSAVERHRMTMPDGSIMHAELTVGDSVLMLGDAQGEWKPMPTAIYLYVPDADATYRQALLAGAKSLMEPADQFYGDRQGTVVDPTGNQWFIATRVEEVLPDEMKRRGEEFIRNMQKKTA